MMTKKNMKIVMITVNYQQKEKMPIWRRKRMMMTTMLLMKTQGTHYQIT